MVWCFCLCCTCHSLLSAVCSTSTGCASSQLCLLCPCLRRLLHFSGCVVFYLFSVPNLWNEHALILLFCLSSILSSTYLINWCSNSTWSLFLSLLVLFVFFVFTLLQCIVTHSKKGDLKGTSFCFFIKCFTHIHFILKCGNTFLLQLLSFFLCCSLVLILCMV